MLSLGVGISGVYEKEATGDLFELAVNVLSQNNAIKARVPMISIIATLTNRNLTDSLLPSVH
jgi:hypothetical protein